MPRFIDIQNPLDLECAEQVFVKRCNGFTDRVDDLGQHASRELQLINVAQVFSDRCERCVTGSFEEADDACQFRATEPRFTNLGRDLANVRFVAGLAVTPQRLVFRNFCPPFLRSPAGFRVRTGLTLSEDGGLELLAEFWVAFASFSSASANFSSSSLNRVCNS
jgi:hypothetical protein